jgi:hypothetical protein
MAGAKTILFLFKDVSRIRVAADEGVEISAANGRAPLATLILAHQDCRILIKSIKDCLGNAAQETTEENLAKWQCAYLLVFFQQAAFGRRRIRDSCHFTILRTKYGQMQVDISTLRVWPQIAVLVIGNKLYHASRNKLIPLCTISTSVSRNTGSCSSEL